MLIACKSCHRQYDVGDLNPGARVRCACGTANAVPRPRARRVAAAHCGNCGAARTARGACEYCGSRPATIEEGLGDPCPECFARLPGGARFCHGCGVEIQPAAVVRAITRSSCPRCQGKLVVAEGRGDPFHQCSECGGIWLSRRAFRRFVERSTRRAVTPEEQRSTSIGVRSRRAPAARRSGRATRRRPGRKAIDCPTCGAPMLTTPYAGYSGVEVDACTAHGWWFDAGELERIGKFLAGGGLQAAARRRQAARRVRKVARGMRKAPERDWRRSTLGLALVALVMGLFGE